MNLGALPPDKDANEEMEIAALIETLRETSQRLEELTSGEVDAVADRHGRTFLLPNAQDELRRSEAARQAAILNALPAQIALLDAQGIIVSVNDGWRRFAEANALQSQHFGIGLNYLDICSKTGDGWFAAHQAGEGVLSVLEGRAKRFSLEYPCDSPTEQGWYQMTVTPLSDNTLDGAIVMHFNTTEQKQASIGLRWKTAFFEALVGTSADGVLVVDTQGIKILQNQRLNELWKIPEEILNDRDDSRQVQFVMNQTIDAKRFGEKVAYLYAHPDEASQDEVELKDGTLLDRYSAPVLDNDGHFYGRIWSFRDITERKKAEQRIAYLNRVYAMLSGVNTLIVRVSGRDQLFKDACRIAVEQGGFRLALIGLVDQGTMNIVTVGMAGKDEELALIKNILAGSDAASQTMVMRAIREKKAIVSNDSQRDPAVAHVKMHIEFGVHSMIILPLMIMNQVVGLLALYANETEFFHEEEVKLLTELADDIAFAVDHIAKEEKLHYLAYYDALTGLASQPLFLERLNERLRAASEQQQKIALFVLDIERFKTINDTYRRRAGDDLLKQVARRIVQISGGDASRFARIGGNQFAFFSSGVDTLEQVTLLAEQRLADTFSAPFQIGDSDLRVSVKLGISLYPDDGADAETLLRNAETALKKAKNAGDRYLFYTQAMNARVADRLSLENRLRQALGREEFVLHYQPKGNLSSSTLTGAEALIRWNDPRSGLVPPGRFIPILEETGLIHEVGRWALRQAIGDYLRWRRAGLPAVRIAVNVSPLQLRDRSFVAEIQEMVGIDPQAPGGLELEITESLIMEDVRHSIASLRAIRDLGVTIAIDDFGTGFSSLSYLSKLPVDTLKIDRSFIIDMTAGPEGLALVSTIINLAHALKLKVVAEGVETEEQSRLLRLLDCDELQGFLFSKAVPGDIFETKFLTPNSAHANNDPRPHVTR